MNFTELETIIDNLTNDDDDPYEDEGDVSVDDVSLCSDKEDEELLSSMTTTENIIDLTTTYGPETDAIKQNSCDITTNNSYDEYKEAKNYMEDSNLNWSFTSDEDFVPDDGGVGEVNSIVSGEIHIPKTREIVRQVNKLCYDSERPRLALHMIF
ncbi:hypothetical protein ACFE04_021797 [Oxalis oulophora]